MTSEKRVRELVKYVMETDFSPMDEKYLDVNWREYKAFNSSERLSFTLWLSNKQYLTGQSVKNVLNELETEEVIYKVCLVRKGVRRFFRSHTEAGKFLGVHRTKITHNLGKRVDKWYVTPCEYMEIVNGNGEVLEATSCVLPYSVV
jgi:hypothetical protein